MRRLLWAFAALAGISAVVMQLRPWPEPAAQVIGLSTVQGAVEAGLVRFTGEDFPRGGEGETRLDGIAFAPGLSPRPLHATLRTHADDETAAHAIVDESVLPLGSPRVLFEGVVSVRFPAEEQDGWVGASETVSGLSLGHAAQPDLATELGLRRRALAFQERAGLTQVREGEPGAEVIRLDPKGAAARAGLRAGDVISRIDGGPVAAMMDLIPRSEGEEVELEVKAPAERSLRTVHLALPGAQGRTHPVTRSYALVFSALLAFLIAPLRPAVAGGLGAGALFKGGLLALGTLLLGVLLGAGRSVWLLAGPPIFAQCAHVLHQLVAKQRCASWVSERLAQIAIFSLAVSTLSVPLDGQLATAPLTLAALAAQPLPLLLWPASLVALVVLAQAQGRLEADEVGGSAALLRAWALATGALVACGMTPLRAQVEPWSLLLVQLALACAALRALSLFRLSLLLTGGLSVLSPALALWLSSEPIAHPLFDLGLSAALGAAAGRGLSAGVSAIVRKLDRPLDPALHPFL